MTRPAIEVVHVGSACRDIAPEDPRGWRLGGGVMYAALTTARLGLRTAAVVGVDDAASGASELDLLRDAGVDVLRVPLREGPIYHNVETPTGRRPDRPPAGRAVADPILPEVAEAPRLVVSPVPVSWRRLGRRSLPTALVAVAWQGSSVTSRPGTGPRRRPGRHGLLAADLVGVSHHDLARRRGPPSSCRALHEGDARW